MLVCVCVSSHPHNTAQPKKRIMQIHTLNIENFLYVVHYQDTAADTGSNS